MIVPFLLVAMVALLLLHGWVLPRRLAREDAGARSDATGCRLPPSGHGFDTRHETSAHWT